MRRVLACAAIASAVVVGDGDAFADSIYVEEAGPLQMFPWTSRVEVSKSGKSTTELIERNDRGAIVKYERVRGSSETPESSVVLSRSPSGEIKTVEIRSDGKVINTVRFRRAKNKLIATRSTFSGTDVFESTTTFDEGGRPLVVRIRRLYKDDPMPREIRFRWKNGRLLEIQRWELSGAPELFRSFSFHYAANGSLRKMVEFLEGKRFTTFRFVSDRAGRLVSHSETYRGKTTTTATYRHDRKAPTRGKHRSR